MDEDLLVNLDNFQHTIKLKIIMVDLMTKI